MGKLLCEKNLRDVWCRNEVVRAEIGQIVHTHASPIDYCNLGSCNSELHFLNNLIAILLCNFTLQLKHTKFGRIAIH